MTLKLQMESLPYTINLESDPNEIDLVDKQFLYNTTIEALGYNDIEDDDLYDSENDSDSLQIVKNEPGGKLRRRAEENVLREAKDYNNLLESNTAKIQSEIKNGKGNCDTTQYFVDLTDFPSEFPSERDAFHKYNEMGLIHRIQFKIVNRKRDDKGKVHRFTLWWYKRKTVPKRINHGIKMKETECSNWPVSVRFRWHPRKNMFIRRMCGIKMTHNHPLDIKETHYTHNQLIQREVKMYLNWHLSVANIRNIINHKFNANVRYSDIYGIVKGFQNGSKNIGEVTKTDFQRLLELLEELREKDPLTQYEFEFDEANDDSPDMTPSELNRILIMTGSMRRLYNQFKDVVFMDATYKSNKHNMPLTVISGVDNEGRNIVLAYALMKVEWSETYKWLMQTFLKFVNYEEPGVILTDFDPSMWYGIERTFEHTTHLLCQWHVLNNLKRHFIFLQKKKGAGPKMLYNQIMELIFTPSPKRFQEIQELIFSSNEHLNDHLLQYLRSMFAIKEKWAEAFSPNLFSAATHTISRAESVNSQIKDRVFSKSSFWDILRLFQELEDRSIEKVITYYKTHEKMVLHHPLLRGMYEYYSSFAFERMLYEYMNCHELVVKKLIENEDNELEQVVVTNAQHSNNGQYIVKDLTDREKWMVYITGI